MERQIHINRCLDASGPVVAPDQTDVESCPVCTVSLGPLTIAERNQHVIECVEGREADADFEDDRDQAVLNAFESALTGSIDIAGSDFQCWMCAKPLQRLSIKTRLSHLADCTRIPKETLESMFLVEGDLTATDNEQYRIKSKGLTPQEILLRLQSIAGSVDRQLLSLNMYRQNLQIQIDRALTLLPSDGNRGLSRRHGDPECHGRASNAHQRKNGGASSFDNMVEPEILPAMKPSSLVRKRSFIRHDAGPESFPEDADARLLVDMASSPDKECAALLPGDQANLLSDFLTQTQ